LLEVGLDNSYSYTKGCYLGQEVVERIRSRGHVNRKLCGLLLDGNTQPTPAIDCRRRQRSRQDHQLRRIDRAQPTHTRSVTFTETSGRLEPQLSIPREDGAIKATVTALPFVAPAPPSS
jgi:folate-binding Fe-S cluster repair protein YgfZ